MKALAALALATLLTASSIPARPAEQSTLTVFAATSLNRAFSEIAEKFKAKNPGVVVKLNFDGSQILETQIANGAPADVFASADDATMKKAVDGGFVNTPTSFAANSLVGVARFDAGAIYSLRDFTQDGLRVVICVETAPCGRYTRIALDKMSKDPHFWKDYGKQVMQRVVSQEPSVEAVFAKVKLGEADAGFVYATDAYHAGPSQFTAFPIPLEDQEQATYPIAVVKNSSNAALARAFADYVLSPDGQAVLATFGFLHKP